MRPIHFISAGLLIAAVAAATVSAIQTDGPHFATEIPWYGQGMWLRADFHIHSQFSPDAARSIETIVAEATKHGCDVVAMTDHADGTSPVGTAEYTEAIRAAREKHPNLTIVTGVEWNVPPGKGTEHATVLVASRDEGSGLLARFRERFDDRRGNVTAAGAAGAGLASLIPAGDQRLAPVVIFNHPSRFPDTPSAPRLTFEGLKATAPSILIGVEGGPGHQRGTPGLYPAGVMTGRWDPLVTEVGGAWDQWLRQGADVWGAIANSDFHNETPNDYWPCEFASTWLYAPDRTVDGVIRALRAGSFFAEHGHIASGVTLQAKLPGLPRPAQAGETVSARVGSKATVSLHMGIPATDFLARANRIDAVELIAISRDKIETLYSGPPSRSEAFAVDVTIPSGGVVVRARGRRSVEGELPLEFYTNPIRIMASGR